jgi:hypothetical protein
MHMAINLVTYRKGGKQADMAAAAKQLKALVLRHGAKDLQLSTVIAGPDAGQWVLVLSFSDWESYGRAMAGSTGDPEFERTFAQLEAAGETVSRRLVAGVDF